MADAPSTFRLADGTTVRRDVTRLAAYLAEPGRVGEPVLTERSRAALRAIGLMIEGDPGPGGDGRSLMTINHGPRLVWLRAIGKISRPPTGTIVSRALGRALAWVAPVYRLPGERGLSALFCGRPDVLLLRSTPGAEAVVDALTDRLGLRRNLDKCRFPGGWRYLEIPAAHASTAFDLLAFCRREKNGPLADLEYFPMRSPYLVTPNDELFSQQWYLERIGAPRAWDIARGARRVVVAVIDSGCDLVHPDLRDAYISEGRNAGDPTGDGSPTVVAATGAPDWHGTAVAGVIGAGLDNTIGVSGVAGGCGLFPVAMPEFSTVQFADAITYAVDSGAQVVNLSQHIGEHWFTMARPIIDAAVARGVVFCGASGDLDESHLIFPAKYPAFMACGGSDQDDLRWRVPAYGYGAGYGDELYDGVPTGVSVVAPADDINTTDISGSEGFVRAGSPWGDYMSRRPGIPSPFNATSASTPQVAAAAALLKSADDSLSGIEIRRIIERTAEKVGGYTYTDVPGYPNGTRHPEMGYGRLNVFRALDLGDVMIADWSGDTGVEPSSPPGGDFFSHSDIVIRPAGDDSFSPDSDTSSRLVRDTDHTVSVRVRNVGPATARDVRVDVRATPFVGLEFIYPDDWTMEDALHVRPTPIDPALLTLARGDASIKHFGLTAAQANDLAGWTSSGWHPCLLAVATAENDYAFETAPAGLSLQTRRNNLAQRNLSVVMVTEARSLRFPFVVGHPANPEPRLELIVEAGALVREAEVYILLADAGEAFPVARRAKAFGKGQVKVGAIAGGKASRLDRRPAVRIESARAVIEIVRPGPGRYALQLAVRLPARLAAPRRSAVRLSQRVRGRGVTGGATVVFLER